MILSILMKVGIPYNSNNTYISVGAILQYYHEKMILSTAIINIEFFIFEILLYRQYCHIIVNIVKIVKVCNSKIP